MPGAVGGRPDLTLCPRCNGSFHCGAADPLPCACRGIQLSPDTTRQLRERYGSHCLCLRCLSELSNPPRTDEKKPAKP
ncbi:MAG: cysteine-rich CWC family protein [Rhizobacter sp.]